MKYSYGSKDTYKKESQPGMNIELRVLKQCSILKFSIRLWAIKHCLLVKNQLRSTVSDQKEVQNSLPRWCIVSEITDILRSGYTIFSCRTKCQRRLILLHSQVLGFFSAEWFNNTRVTLFDRRGRDSIYSTISVRSRLTKRKNPYLNWKMAPITAISLLLSTISLQNIVLFVRLQFYR